MSNELQDRMDALIATGRENLFANYAPAPIVLDRGQGSIVFDIAGNRYVDMVAGVAVSSLGHSHPKVLEVLAERSQHVLHTSNLYFNEPSVLLAKLLVDNSFADRVFFCQSGAEANEGALKLARRFYQSQGHKRFEIITALQSFHGRTLGALTATGQEKYHQCFQPLIPGFQYVPYGDIEALKKTIGERTAAVMLEPVQGEGGVRIPEEGYLQAVRQLCDDTGTLLIFDEVQTGVGRTGTFLANEGIGVTPDITTLAKGLAGGLPLGALLAKEEISKALVPGSHATTFGGNPLGCAVACAVVETVAQKEFLAQVKHLGEVVLQHLNRMKERFDACVEARGAGLLCGLEVDRELPGFVDKARQHGVLTNVIGGRVIRVAPPLVVTEEELEEGMQGLEKALEECLSGD